MKNLSPSCLKIHKSDVLWWKSYILKILKLLWVKKKKEVLNCIAAYGKPCVIFTSCAAPRTTCQGSGSGHFVPYWHNLFSSNCRRLWIINTCWKCPSRGVLVWFCDGPELMDRVSDSHQGAVESSWSTAGAEETRQRWWGCGLLPTDSPLLENICFKAWTW